MWTRRRARGAVRPGRINGRGKTDDVAVEIIAGGQHPDEVRALLAELPEWFGLEASNRAYVEAARSLPTYVARGDGDVVGACLVKRHFAEAAEIELLAVRHALHRQGIGRQIITRVEVDLRGDGVQLLQVKTRGPSGTSEPYERTRAFYTSLGFLPLEERMDIWGPDNPCLIMVKPLQ